MSYEIEMYQNVINPLFKKAQIDKVMFSKQFSKKIEEITDDLLNKRIFFKITFWLVRKNNFQTNRFYGKITKITEKAIKINNYLWFPKSQITEIYLYKPTFKHKTLLSFTEGDE